MTYNSKDVFQAVWIQSSASFVEIPLVSAPNTTVVFDANSNLVATASTAASISASYSVTSDTSISASHAVDADTALTAALSIESLAADFAFIADSASSANTSSWADNAISASFATTASWASLSITASSANTSSWADNSISTSYAISASVAVSASYLVSSSYANSASYTTFASNANSSSYSITSSNAESSSYAISSSATINAISSSVAVSASYSVSSSYANSASYSITASNALSSSYIIPGASFYQVSGSSGSSPSYIDSFEVSNGNTQSVEYHPPFREGRMFYNQEAHVWNTYTDTSDFRLHLGKEVIWRGHNESGTTINKGSAVYVSGSTGDFPNIYLALADGTNTKSDVVGVARHNIDTGVEGWIIQNGIMISTDMSGFNTGDPVFLSKDTPGGLVNVDPGQPYESVRIGNCAQSGVDGKLIISPVFAVPPAITYAGITSDVVITDNLSGSVYISTGSVNLFNTTTGFGPVYGHPLSATTLSLVTGSTNYIVAEMSGSNAIYTRTTDSTYANGINIVRVATLDIYNADTASWDVHKFDVGIVGLALANRINNKDIRLYGYQRELGLTLYTTGSSGSFGITNGTIWYGPNSHIIPTFDTTITGHYTYLFESTASNGTSSWNRTTQIIFETGYYNSSSYGKVACTENSWSVNYVYRLIGTEDESAIVMSNAQFATELDASNNATPPPNLPSTIVDIGLLVGRFIIQSGSYTPTIESAFSNVFIPSVVTDHESLTGIQGGQGGEHYHLTLTDRDGTGTGVMVRQSNATMSNPQFAGATQYHIPYWNASKQLTLTGSVQVFQDQYVLINSSSFPDITNQEALLIRQLNTSSVNSVGAYATVDNFSQIYNQNLSNGTSASTDIAATADVGGQYTNYIDMGVASSKYTGSTWPWTKALDGYVQVDGGDFWLATITDNKLLFAFNNTSSTNYADKTGFYLSGSWFGTSSFANNSTSASYSVSASNAITASYSISSSRSEMGLSSSNALTASYSITSSFAESGSNTISSSHTLFADSSSYSLTASYAISASNTETSSHSISSSYSNSGSYSITSSYADNVSIALESQVFTLEFTYKTGTDFDDPGNGNYKLDNVASASINNIYIDSLTKNGLDVSVFIRNLRGNQKIYVQDKADSTKSFLFSLSGSSVDNTGWFTIPVTFVGSPGGGFPTNNKPSVFVFINETSIVSGSTYPVTASWAINSTSASYSNSSSYSITSSLSHTSSYSNSGSYSITASYAVDAISSSHSITSSFALNSGGTSITTGSTYPITSSWSTTSSYALSSSQAELATSASYAGTSSFLTRNGTYEVTASWANSSSVATSASYAGTSSFLTRNRTYEVTSSWAVTSSFSISSSWSPTASVVFSRGGVFYDATGIAGVMAQNQNLMVWRAPFACTVQSVHGYRVGGDGAWLNARKNGIGTILTSSLTSSADTWASITTVQSSSFVTGDKLEIMLVTSSNYPTQSAVQVDFLRS